MRLGFLTFILTYECGQNLPKVQIAPPLVLDGVLRRLVFSSVPGFLYTAARNQDYRYKGCGPCTDGVYHQSYFYSEAPLS